MNEQNDFLYVIFEKHLTQETPHEQSFEEFSQTVVNEYIFALAKQGVLVPTQLKKTLESDLIEDVIDMTRKKTYGFLSLTEYRQLKLKK